MANQPKRPQHRPIDNNYGHLQPQAPDIEKIVLGALMIDKDAFTIVGEILHPETFYEPRNQKIYSAIQKLNIDELTCRHPYCHRGTETEGNSRRSGRRGLCHRTEFTCGIFCTH